MSYPVDSKQELLKRHEIVRSMIQHENNLIGIRIGWMIACFGLFLTAIGIGDFADIPSIFICIVGTLVSWNSFRNIRFAEKAIDKLKNSWTKPDRDRLYSFPDVIGYGRDEEDGTTSSFTPPLWVTLYFFLFWISLGLYYGHHWAACQFSYQLKYMVYSCGQLP